MGMLLLLPTIFDVLLQKAVYLLNSEVRKLIAEVVKNSCDIGQCGVRNELE